MADIPVLPATLLGLELLAHQSSVDLAAVSRLLRADPGALLQLFAVLARECASTADSPVRVEECIASMPVKRLLRALVGVNDHRHDHARLAAFAEHARTIGRYAQAVAESLDLHGEQALLIGTLHEIGSLPWVLGWQPLPPTPSQAALFSQDICQQYRLPGWLCSAVVSLHAATADSVWSTVIAAAHELAGHA